MSFTARQLAAALALVLVTSQVARGAAEFFTSVPSDLNTATLPAKVAGLQCRGTQTRPVSVALKDGAGRLQAQPTVAVLHSPAWSPDDAERDGASEFEVMMCTARVLRESGLGGVVGVGNRHGLFLPAAEQALHRAALMGVPIVKLSSGSEAPSAATGSLFIRAGDMAPNEARNVLASCLLRYGALPPVRDPAKPTARELTAIRTHLSLYQAIFDAHAGRRVAMQ